MPSIPALLKITGYWLLWLLIARRLLQGHSLADSLPAIAWALFAAAVAAWFTWIALHDDKQERLYGKCSDDDDGPASPASRFAGALTLGFGSFGCLAIGALVPELRSALLPIALVGFIAAGYVLFFGRKSSNSDVDL